MTPDQATLFTPPLSDPTANVRGKMHRFPRDTERRAAQLVQPKTGTQSLKVLRFIASRGYHGATDWEIVDNCGLLLSSVNGRRNFLLKGGWIFDTGERRTTPHTRMPGIVWCLTPEGQKGLKL